MPSIVTEFIGQYGELLGQGVLDTLVMLFISTAIAYVIGTVLGVVLYLTSPGSLRPMRALNAVLGWVVNIGRSLPFIILLISLMPVTSALVGTTSGVRGVIPPLVVSTAPFVARMIEQSLAEVPARERGGGRSMRGEHTPHRGLGALARGSAVDRARRFHHAYRRAWLYGYRGRGWCRRSGRHRHSLRVLPL